MNKPSEHTIKIMDNFFANWYDHVNRLVIETTAELLRPTIKFNNLRHMGFGENLDMIAYAAEGLYDWDEDTGHEVFCGIQYIYERLFATPYSYTYEIPSDFHQSPIGNLVLMARIWASGNLSSINIDYPTPDEIHISLSQSTLDYLKECDVDLFWKVDAGQPYWARIPVYEGDFFLAETQDFILDSSTNLLSITCHIPSLKPNYSI